MDSWIHGSPDLDGGTHYDSTGFQDACKMIGIRDGRDRIDGDTASGRANTVYPKVHKPR